MFDLAHVSADVDAGVEVVVSQELIHRLLTPARQKTSQLKHLWKIVGNIVRSVVSQNEM